MKKGSWNFAFGLDSAVTAHSKLTTMRGCTMQSKETADFLGIKKSRLRFYCTKGLIRPALDANGHYVYSPEDIQYLQELLRYRKAGVPIEMLKEIRDGKLAPAEALRKTREILMENTKALQESLALCESLLNQISENAPES